MDLKALSSRYWELSSEMKNYPLDSRQWVLTLKSIMEIRALIDQNCTHDYRFQALNHFVCISCGLDKP
jgi:hypothetical protein